jgi:AcrR family transcriptional regulator
MITALAKEPRTDRGRRTLRKLLDAAADEFGELGYHQAAISSITQRAGVALGSFYTYFDSKEAVFRALVADMGRMTRQFLAEQLAQAPDRLTMEQRGTAAFIAFARSHKNLYRIVMESQFVAEDAYRDYYATFAAAYRANLNRAAGQGEIRDGHQEYRAWALIGMNVFLGMRFAVWDDQVPVDDIAAAVGDLVAHGLAPA